MKHAALVILLFILLGASIFIPWYSAPVPFAGTVEAIAASLFMDNLLPFLLAAVLLLAAMIGAIYLAKKEAAA